MTPEEQDIHAQILKEALQAPEKEPNVLFKWFIAILAVLVLVSFLLVYLGNGQGLQFFEGRAKSETIGPEYIIHLDQDREIYLTKTVYESLILLWRNSEGNEFKVCLLGKKTGKKYEISSFYVPKVYGKGYDHVIAELCTEKTIIPLHSHPVDHCVFSEQDLKSYEQFKSINQDALMGLMCSIDRFSFYG